MGPTGLTIQNTQKEARTHPNRWESLLPVQCASEKYDFLLYGSQQEMPLSPSQKQRLSPRLKHSEPHAVTGQQRPLP